MFRLRVAKVVEACVAGMVGVADMVDTAGVADMAAMVVMDRGNEAGRKEEGDLEGVRDDE